MKMTPETKKQIEIVCDYVRDRTIEYGIWINDLGMFGIDVPEFQILSNNYIKCLIRKDIKGTNLTTLTGNRLDKVIEHALASLQKIYIKKHKEFAESKTPQ